MMLSRYLCSCVCGLFLVISISLLGYAETVPQPANNSALDRSLHFQNDSISADLKNVPLNQILQYICKETNIWFQVKNSLLNENVTIKFNDLPIEEGLKRILANLNYSMSYDAKGKLTGFIIIESSKRSVNTHSGSSSNASMIKASTSTPETYKRVHDKDQTSEETASNTIRISAAVPVKPNTIPKRPPSLENIQRSTTTSGTGHLQGTKK